MGPASSAFAPPRSVHSGIAQSTRRPAIAPARRPALAPLRRPALVPALLALAALLTACSQEGTTPQCEANVSKDGVHIRNMEGQLFSDQPAEDYTKQPCTAFGRCYLGGNLAPAIQCCCPALNFVSNETGKLVEHAVKNGQCVRQDTNEVIPADRYDLVQCRYGFGEVELDTSGGGGSGNGGNGGSGGG
jgi:hypothetical protein